MRILAIVMFLVLTHGTLTSAQTITFELNFPANEINVTSDSSPGWLPTIEQRQRALKTTEVFLNALENGRYPEAYEMLTEINRSHMQEAQFVEEGQKFRALAGPVKFWRVLKVTSTKDPARAPFPGIYAAIDLAAQFANVDRDCGYMVLYQPAPGKDFTIMRREHNYLDNATAGSIEEKQSKDGLAKAWAQLSRSCPNYGVVGSKPQ